MRVRLTHIDGKLPNIALMKLSHFHKSRGDKVHFTKDIERGLFEDNYDKIYASSIFAFTQTRLSRFMEAWPGAIIGGTGTKFQTTIEQVIGLDRYEKYDYSIYPNYEWSIGFTQRGCRLRCKFCVVPEKEGRPKSVNSISDIWRPKTEKKIVLLDNDFFGQPKSQLEQRVDEILSGGFKVSFMQGINIRLIDETAAKWLSQIKYYDDQFKTRRLYTAWDNLKDEEVFFRGVDLLESHNIPPTHLFVYMLIGFDPAETWGRIFYRFNKMIARGIRPYPMVYNNKDKELKRFQRWVIRRYYEIIPWKEFGKIPEPRNESQLPLMNLSNRP